MRWLNGLTWDEKEKKYDKKREYYENWHKWFAWYPIKVDMGRLDSKQRHRYTRIWLEYVQRKTQGRYYETETTIWMYKDL